jgi:KDO2-lipid IV(A) lauroyltransferase
MNAFKYSIIKGLIWVVTLPPLKILYLFSDILYILNKYIIKYRYNVVNTNITKAFPDKSPKEISQIRDSFYRYFFDLIVEVVKAVHYTEKDLNKRYRFKNLELFHKYYNENKPVALVSGHCGNWEWMINFQPKVKNNFQYIYHPLKNPYSDKLVNSIRSKTGAEPVPMKQVMRTAMTQIKEDPRFVLWFLADQRPHKPAKFWTIFLNQEASFFQGFQKLSKKLDMAVVYMAVERTERGHYEVSFDELCYSPSEYSEDEISHMFVKRLEENIRQQPPFWLWSHKRWKQTRPEGYNLFKEK